MSLRSIHFKYFHTYPTKTGMFRMLRCLLPALALLPAAGAEEPSAPSRRPDIVFIMTDDQAFDAVSNGTRFPFFKMPNLDRLARSGVTFSNAFATTSLCGPSRATCMTGLYSHKTGVPSNDPPVDPAENVPLISELLQKAGYETAFIGKWHMAPGDQPRRGFDYWLSFKGQGVYFDPVLNLNGKEFQAKGYITDILTDYAVDWMEKRPKDKPFALFLWHKAPHEKVESAARHLGLFQGMELAEPPNYRDTYRGKPEWERRGVLYGLHKKAWQEAQGKPVPPEIGVVKPFEKLGLGKLFENYLRALVAVDESTGRVLDTLGKAGRRENSLIIYTSDNGFNIAAHQSPIDKRTMWEESIRIPLVIQFPAEPGAGTKQEAMVLNVDYAPTILDAAGIPIPAYMDGKPLQPLASGQAPGNWRKSFLYVYQRENYAPGIATMAGVRTGRYKYIRYPEEKEGLDELFDLKTDPYELRNAVNDPEYREVLSQMQKELVRLSDETGYKLPEKAGAAPAEENR